MHAPTEATPYSLCPAPQAPENMDDVSSNRELSSLRQIEAMQAVHQQQRLRLEAELESSPQSYAGFSQQLIRSLQREEEALAKRGENDGLARRVEGMLASETTKLFKLRGQKYEERWRALFERQHYDRKRLFEQIKEQESQESRPKVEKADDFTARETAMRAASAERWADDELFCLKNAFDLQLKRLEVDWAAHEAKVGVEYDARRVVLEARAGVAIEGCRIRRVGSSEGADAGASGRGREDDGADDAINSDTIPWRNREKQSRLIHTAPVFRPDSGRISSAESTGGGRNPRIGQGARRFGGSHGGVGRRSAGRWVRGAEEELQRLDTAFLSLCDQVRAQKEAAQKWIRRQRIRMEAQAEAMGQERVRRQQRLSAAQREEAQMIAAVLAEGR